MRTGDSHLTDLASYGLVKGPFWASVLALATACAGGSVAGNRERSLKQYELAIGLQAEGNQVGAFKTLQEALELDPENDKAHQLMASLYLLYRDDDVERHDKLAEEHFKKAIELQSTKDEPDKVLLADAYNGLGVLRIHQGDYDAAVTLLKQAVDVDPFNPGAYMAWGNLGWAYQELGKIEDAQKALLRSVKLNSGFCVGHYRLGSTYLATKKYEDADQALTQALEAHESCETFQDAWHLRGEARMNLGHRDDARADFERCVELAPKTEAGASCGRYLEATN